MSSPPPPISDMARLGPAPAREESSTRKPWVRPHLVRVEESPANETQSGFSDGVEVYSRATTG